MGSYFPSCVELRGSYWKSWANTPPFFIFPHNSIALREFENSFPFCKIPFQPSEDTDALLSELPPFSQNVHAADDSSWTFIAQCKMAFVQRLDITKKSVMVCPGSRNSAPLHPRRLPADGTFTCLCHLFLMENAKNGETSFVSISAAVVRSLTFVVFGQ
jgi:hypothetical protein